MLDLQTLGQGPNAGPNVGRQAFHGQQQLVLSRLQSCAPRFGPPFDEALLPVPETFIGREADLDWLLRRLSAQSAGVTALAMLRDGRKQDAWTVAVSTGGAMAINTMLKNVFERQRPQNLARRIKLPKSHSFPSGHSLLSAATYPIVAHHLVQNRSVATQAVVHTLTTFTILSVGFSRVYFGVHFPSDVLGGFAAGFGWLGLTSLSHTVVERDEQENR